MPVKHFSENQASLLEVTRTIKAKGSDAEYYLVPCKIPSSVATINAEFIKVHNTLFFNHSLHTTYKK